MAKYLGKHENKPFFIKNSDKYSLSTSQYQGLVQQYCPDPTISRTAIEPIYARGMVSHSGGEHRVLRLGELLHEVYRKAEGRSWSAEGSFD